MITFEQQ